MRRGLALVAVCGGLAGLFATASQPQPSALPRTVLQTGFVGFEPHAGKVVKVRVPGGSCSFSLSPRDFYSYECDWGGADDHKMSEAVAEVRPILKRHDLCVTTVFGLGGSASLVHRCGESFQHEFLGASR